MAQMPEKQKAQILEMDSGEVLDFQLRLQIECGMTHQEAADYIAQAFKDQNLSLIADFWAGRGEGKKMIYETGLMNFHKAQLFEIWFMKNIGAEIEINTINDDINQIYFICSDLAADDVALLKDWENKGKEEKNV